jgi:hypothetical protein
MKSGFALILALLSPIAGAAPNVVLVPTPNAGIQPVAQLDARGRLHLIYFRGDPAHGDLFHTVRPLGGTEFGKTVRINATEGSAIATGTIRGASLALGSEGQVHVAWMGSSLTAPDEDHHRTPMLYARSTDGGMTFEPERNLITEAYGLDGGGAIAADPNGHVAVFWHAGPPDTREPGRRVWVTRSNDEGKTFAPEVAAWDEPTGVCGCCGMNAAFGADHFWAIYRSAGERVHRDIFLLKSEVAGPRFHGERLDQWEIEACPMSAMSLAFAGDKTAAAWEAKGGNIGFTFAGTEIRGLVPHGKDARKYPSIALAPDGHLLVAWIEGAGWQKAGRLGWQVFDHETKAIGEPESGKPTPVWSKPAAIFDGRQFVVIY